MNSIENKFREKAIAQTNFLIFPKAVAIDVVKAYQNAAIPIWGIDAFIIHPGNVVQPDMGESINFSPPDYKVRLDSIYADAIDFLNDKDDRLYFEVVVIDDEVLPGM